MNTPRNDMADDARIEALLKAAGARVTPPTDLMDEVRAAVHEDWRQFVSERTRKRRVRWTAAAASVAAIAVAATGAILTATDAPEMAVAMRIDGQVDRDAGWLHAGQAVSTGAPVYVGDEISTGPDSRAAFAVADGIELRIDSESRVRLVAANRVKLEHGALYVDSDPIAHEAAATFVVAAQQATVRHIGTQYQVRTTANGVHVSVREGRVVVDLHGALHEGRAGEQLEIIDGREIARSALAKDDPLWQWVYSLAPPFDINDRSLDEFLEWFSHETGRKVAFATPQLAQAAQNTTLRGSIAGLEPRAALEAVLATSNLVLTETSGGELIVQTPE